ncbi:MAG TPA: phenylalanine--tRNA ligase subunit beta [Nitrososphaerales archaeon]|nr:phenylalanine--tRNA ligase subunit beta [Nitrososphaerales archaeon]
MPVVSIDIRRFSRMVGVDRKRILDRLPYIGLDIEGVERNSVRVEYSPNRPDFGTDFGIARALRGLLGEEVGLPKFLTVSSGVRVSVDRKLESVRPFIACATVRGLDLDDESIRQIISLQEDLHNGIGRRRRVVAIGLHDMDAVDPPFAYRAVGSAFEFVPLGGKNPVSVSSILSDTDEGKVYGAALGGSRLYPVITDSHGVVLSFPPIINGDATRVTTKTRNMFIDVTSTDRKAGDDILAVVATTLAEAGGKLGTVTVSYPGKPRVTPDLSPIELPIDHRLVRTALGMNLSAAEIAKSLARSRLGVKRAKALAPRYRIDLLHPVDIAEEVALGYGFDRIESVYPPSRQAGSFNPFEDYMDSASTVMAGSGMIEIMTFELTDERSLYTLFQRSSSEKLVVLNPKSIEHSFLRDALIPSLMASLSGNVKSDYPQRIFEIGRVYTRAEGRVHEAWHLGCLVAHSQASFTEAKMYLESFCRIITGTEATTEAGEHWAFSRGRCAKVIVKGESLGHVGEVKPEAIDGFGLGVPVSGFEIDISALHELLK